MAPSSKFDLAGIQHYNHGISSRPLEYYNKLQSILNTTMRKITLDSSVMNIQSPSCVVNMLSVR